MTAVSSLFQPSKYHPSPGSHQPARDSQSLPIPAQPGQTRVQRQFTSHLVDLYLIPIPTPPTPSIQPRLSASHSPPLPGPSPQRPSPQSGANPVSGVTFSPHDIPPVPVPGTANRPATRPYLFYARTGRNQAQTLDPRQLPYFTHQIPPVPYVISLATAPPTSATHDVCRILEAFARSYHNFVTDGSPREGNQQQVRFRLTHNVNARRKTATRVTNLSPESEASNPRDITRRPTAAAGQKLAAADPTGPPSSTTSAPATAEIHLG